MPPEAAALQFLELDASHRRAVAAVAHTAFRSNSFYTTALGFDERDFSAYWEEFFDLALRDSNAAVYALTQQSNILAAVAVAFDGFPALRSGIRFLLRLLLRLGPVRFACYLRFALQYQRVMRRPSAERRLEACGQWLFTEPSAGIRLGSRLVRQTAELMRNRGKPLITGFVEADNRPLLAFYRRNGFSILLPFDFAGLKAARVERWLVAPRWSPAP